MARTFAAFESKRFHQINAGSAAKVRSTSIGCSHFGVGGKQMPLRAGAEAIEDLRLAALVKEIAIAIARKEPRTAAQAEETRVIFRRRFGNFERANVGLVVA